MFSLREIDQLLHDDARLFAGTITASLSHEINNVLAIVNELSGLLQDFLVSAEKGRHPSPERRESVSAKIASQVDRGKYHIQQLNRFAHSVDKPKSEFDAKETSEFTMGLLERFARLRKVEIVLSLDEISKPLMGSSFDFQHLMYRCMELVLGLVNQKAAISVELQEKPSGVGLRFAADDLKPAENTADFSQKLSLLNLLLQRAKGSLVFRHRESEDVEIAVELPYNFTFRAEASSHS